MPGTNCTPTLVSINPNFIQDRMLPVHNIQYVGSLLLNAETMCAQNGVMIVHCLVYVWVVRLQQGLTGDSAWRSRGHQTQGHWFKIQKRVSVKRSYGCM